MAKEILTTKLLKKFLGDSETFEGISFQGSYNIPQSAFMILLEHYILTRENLLDSYTTVMNVWWDTKDDNCLELYSHEKYIKLASICTHSVMEKLFSKSVLNNILEYALRAHDRYIYYTNREPERNRQTACLFTTNPTVRKKVFTLHGKICLCCNTTKNISLDHVIPVAVGGENSIDNMQPLCRSCNSKKGTKIIDYRRVSTI